MVPKMLKYCRLSSGPYPPVVEKFIPSRMEKIPDYQINNRILKNSNCLDIVLNLSVIRNI